MSRGRDDHFLDALLGADPDEATPPAPRRAARGTVEAPPSPAPEPAPQRRATAQVDLKPAPAPAEPARVDAGVRRPGAYEPVLPVPDDPDVVADLQERAGIVTDEPQLAGFLEGLLGIVAPAPEVASRDRLIAVHAGDATAPGTDAAENDAETPAAEPAAASVEQPAVAEVADDRVEVPMTTAPVTARVDSVPEDDDEESLDESLPPLSHDVVEDEESAVGEGEEPAAAAAPGTAEAAGTEQAPQPAAATAAEPQQAPESGASAPAEPPAAAAPAAAEAAAPPAEDATSELVRSLTSFDVGRRRTALVNLLERPLDRELATAAASSLRDPESGIRLLALQVLERAPELAPVEALEVTMADPEPEIRRRAATLIGRTGDLRLLSQLRARLEEETDEDVMAAGLTAVADLFRVAGEQAGSAELDLVSATVGNLRTAALPQLGRELTVLARTLDAGEIRHRLGDVDETVRVGAAVLALESGSEDSLRALARLVTDGSGRVRQLAMTAVSRLRSAGGEPPEPPAPSARSERGDDGHEAETTAPRREGMSRAVADEVQGALLPGLLEALSDPKQEIRDQARNALALVDRDRLVDYIDAQAQEAGAEELVRLIGAAQRLGLDETVPALAGAALRHAGTRGSAQLAEALQDVPALDDLLERWRASEAPEPRADALRLASLVEADPAAAILAGLADPNPHVRLVGVETARGRLDDRLAEALLGLIERDPSTRVQVAALEAFRDAPGHERSTAARAAAGSPVAEVRRHGLELLAPRASEDFNQLAAALRDDDPAVVETAARLLSSSGGPEATALLWSEIRGAGDARHLLLEVLHAEQPEALARLAHRAIESMDPAERAAGLAALAMLGAASARDQIIASLGDPSVDVRLEALHALAGEPGAAGTAPLAAVMRDADPRVRARAVDVIAGTEDEEAVPLLVRALDDPAEAVRLATRRALGRVRSPAAVDLLLEALARPAHRAAAVEALAALGQPATGRLVRALASSTGEVREAVREALLRSGAVERTVDSLRDPRPARRRAALTLLRAVRPESIAAAVAERLEDPNPEVRQLAAQLLGELGDRSVVPALQHAFVNDPDMDVVAAVETAYRRLGGGEAR